MTIARVLVVGGGLAGMATAIGIRHRSSGSVAVDVAEVSYEPNGTAMGMFHRAADALRELGVYEELAGINTEARASHMRLYGPDGSALPGSFAGPDAADAPDTPIGLIVYRPDLARVLANAAEKEGARLLPVGLTVAALANSPSGVDVTLTDGSRAHYDLVVGADGIRSSVRQQVFGDRCQPRFVGELSVRWIMESEGIDLAPGVHISPSGTFLHNRPKPGMGYVNCTFPASEKKTLDPDRARTHLEEVFAGFTDPAVGALRGRLGPDSDVVCKAFESVWLDEPWYRDRVVVIGDAAHATSAHLGSGGAMALEDGVVLAAELSGSGSVEERLDRFYRRRRDRAELVVRTSLRLLELEAAGQWAGPESARLTNEALGHLIQPY
ncbi:FAD-dependent monooxygenase [Streptomyces sp. NRRL B-3229]|uniref:FAD-dependent monooxygenase n=1 Tax=Streptomyces sp. NRRL B-3229 TaxID=1463836 RepID=UPI000AA0BFBD|nr:FAD-dependent monooxygenase [Streptomyces sp. NRRL B-3229]